MWEETAERSPHSGLQAQTDHQAHSSQVRGSHQKGKGEIPQFKWGTQTGGERFFGPDLVPRSRKAQTNRKSHRDSIFIESRLCGRGKREMHSAAYRQQGNVIAKISSLHTTVRIMRKIPVGFVHSPRIKSCAYKQTYLWNRIHLQCGRPGFHPWAGEIPWRRAWHPTPVFLPEEFHGQRAWRAKVHEVAKSRTRLSD